MPNRFLSDLVVPICGAVPRLRAMLPRPYRSAFVVGDATRDVAEWVPPDAELAFCVLGESPNSVVVERFVGGCMRRHVLPVLLTSTNVERTFWIDLTVRDSHNDVVVVTLPRTDDLTIQNALRTMLDPLGTRLLFNNCWHCAQWTLQREIQTYWGWRNPTNRRRVVVPAVGSGATVQEAMKAAFSLWLTREVGWESVKAVRVVLDCPDDSDNPIQEMCDAETWLDKRLPATTEALVCLASSGGATTKVRASCIVLVPVKGPDGLLRGPTRHRPRLTTPGRRPHECTAPIP